MDVTKRGIELIQPSAGLEAGFGDIDHLIALLGPGAAVPAAFDPEGRLTGLRGRHGHDDEQGQPLVVDLVGRRLSVNWLGGDAQRSMFEDLRLARRHVEAHTKDRPRSVAVLIAGLDETAAHGLAEAVVLALLAATTVMPARTSRPRPEPRLERIVVAGLGTPLDRERLLAADAGNALARYLTGLPSNELRPADYRSRIMALAEQEGWELDCLDRERLEALGAGAFLAVCRGSNPADGAGIVRLRYRPPGLGASEPAGLALVGKGICFDTGGVNLKPARHMHGMHEDMQGSAVAVGTLLALGRLGVPFGIDCWLALAVNDIGPAAFRQNEVVEACNGTTIEIVHTDAEGRLVLADALALASRESPGLIIDYATLTGSCVHALSTRYSGVCTNRDFLREVLVEAGRASGERVWPFPLDTDFDEAIESRVADCRQCALEGEADQIIAARFLQRFVDDRPWVHLDLSAGNHKGGLAHVPTDISGFGVLFSLALLLDHQVIDAVREG